MDQLQQIARLQERLAWLERHVVEQDKVMLEMSEDIVRLRREVHAFRERLPSGGQAEPDGMPNDRPPHY